MDERLRLLEKSIATLADELQRVNLPLTSEVEAQALKIAALPSCSCPPVPALRRIGRAAEATSAIGAVASRCTKARSPSTGHHGSRPTANPPLEPARKADR